MAASGGFAVTVSVPSDGALHGDELRGQNRFNGDAKVREQAITLDIIQSDFSDIFAPIQNKVIPDEAVTNLLHKASANQPGQIKRIRHNTIVKFLRDGVLKHGWDVNIPAYVNMVQGEKAVATPGAFVQLRCYRELSKCYYVALSDYNPPCNLSSPKPSKYEAGQLIFSMISWGGLHHLSWLESAVERLTAGISSLGAVYWYDLTRNDQLRRWFPDSLTVLLIRRWYRRWGKAWPDESPAALFEGFVRRLHGVFDTPLKKINAFINAASTASSLESCGFLHHYQTNSNSSVSLPQTAWWRLNTKKRPLCIGKNDDEPVINFTPPTVDADALRGKGSIDGLFVLRKIRNALSGQHKGKSRTRKQMAETLAEIGSDRGAAPILRVLALWCRSQVTRKQDGGSHNLKVSSIRTYVSRIGQPLTIKLSDVQDLNELDSYDWEHVYADIIDSARTNIHKSNRAFASRRFHDFLTERFAIIDTFIEQVSASRVVDAEILTPAEFKRAFDLLSRQNSNPRLAKMCRLVLTLGFRCGLRRGEVHTLQLGDFHGLCVPELSRPELLVRPSKFGTVKSNAGVRRLPLRVLLTSDELCELRNWVQFRRSEQIANRPLELVFCDRNSPNTLISPRLLFDPIKEAMRIASGADLRFHHLRHSFATFTALRLLESTSGQLFPEEWASDDSGDIVMPCWGEDVSALVGLPDASSVTAKRLWMLSQLVGHATPGETLRSYMHLTDWLAYKWRASSRCKALSTEQQACVLGIDPASVSVFRTRHCLSGRTTANDLVSACSGGWPAGFRTSKLSELTSYVSPKLIELDFSELCAQPVTAMGVYYFFNKMAVLESKGVDALEAIAESASHFGISPEKARRWHQRAMRMMNDSTDKKAVKGVCRRWSAHHQGVTPNPFTASEQKKNPGVTLPELAQCPAPPTPHSGQELANYIFEKLVRCSQYEPREFGAALDAVQNAMQRSHQQISFRSDANKKRFRWLLRQADLCHLLKVIVKPAPGSDYSHKQIRAYWSEQLSVRFARVEVSNELAIGQRNPWGVAQLEVLPNAKMGASAKQMTMTTVRFALFTAAVVFDGGLEIDTKRLEFGGEPLVVGED